MSSSEVMTASGTQMVPAPARAAIPVQSRLGARFLRSELRLLFRRRRTLAILAVLALAPVLIGVAIKVSAPSSSNGGGDGPAFINQIAGNGLFLAFTGLATVLPFFLPLAVSVVSGDSVAGEAQSGTLRYLLTVPVARTRLLLVKYASIVVFCLVATLLVSAVGMLMGRILFPVGPVTLLSGDQMGYGQTVVRAVLCAAYVAAMLAGLGAIGLFVSTLTEVPIGAAAATVILSIVSQILDAVPQVSWLHPWLFTHPWNNFADLLREPILWSTITKGLALTAAYVAVFGTLAWARFTSKDITA